MPKNVFNVKFKRSQSNFVMGPRLNGDLNNNGERGVARHPSSPLFTKRPATDTDSQRGKAQKQQHEAIAIMDGVEGSNV